MGKKYKAVREKVDHEKNYAPLEGLSLLMETKIAKFDETVDVAIRLGVDARKSDQMVRGAVKMPQGLGKVVRILVFAKGEEARKAEAAGADFVGEKDLLEKIKGGWLAFDTVIAKTPQRLPTTDLN